MTFETAQKLYQKQSIGRMLKNAVPEAKNYPRALCNQRCSTHVYIKDGIPYDQISGLKHDCLMARIAKMFIGHYRMIRIDKVKDSSMFALPIQLEAAENWCHRWSLAFDNWKKTGKVPTSEEVEDY